MKFGGKDGRILVEFADKKNWSPKFSQIARKLKLPISTIYDRYNKLLDDVDLECEMRVRLKL